MAQGDIKRGRSWAGFDLGLMDGSTAHTVVMLDPATMTPVSPSNVTITGPVTVSNEVEVKNDVGNPLPVSFPSTPTVNIGTIPEVEIKNDSGNPVTISVSARTCVGRQTISVTTATVVTLTPPVGAVAATIQADGSAISLTLDGTTAPTSTIGLRVDDGVFFYVDTLLSGVKMIARVATTNVQVCYFDRA